MIRCLRCFEEYPDVFGVCPVCGNSVGCLSDDSDSLKAGSMLHDRYIVGCEAGRGGFGRVYRGFDRLTSTVIAVKELFVPSLVRRSCDGTSVEPLNSRSDTGWIAVKKRFYSEAAAEISAPASVGCALFDLFEENGTVYMIMEYLGGRTVASVIVEGGTDLPGRAELIIRAARAVSALHASGRTHLDLAPDNIMAVDDGEGGSEIRLIDFGSSGRGSGLPAGPDRIFKEGYSSPELAAGNYDPRIADGGIRSDVYSLGATAYILLTGKRPPDTSPKKYKNPVPPHELMAEIPVGISDAVMKAMDPCPGERFASAGEFAAALAKAAEKAGLCGSPEKKRSGTAPGKKEKTAAGKRIRDVAFFFRASGTGGAGRGREPRDISFERGVTLRLPERLLPGTVAGGRYEIGDVCTREGDCLVYPLDRAGIFTGLELCEFFPPGICRRADDGITADAGEKEWEFSDLCELFSSSVTGFSLFRDDPAGDGFTDLFADNRTVYAVRRAGQRINPVRKSGKVTEETAKRAAFVIGDAFDYITGLHRAGLCHGNISYRSLRLTAEGRVSVFSPQSIFYNLSNGHEMPAEYMPPEYRKRSRTGGSKAVSGTAGDLSYAGDIYMLAVLYCRIVAGILLPSADIRKEKILRDEPDPAREAVFKAFRSGRAGLIMEALDFNPAKRKGDYLR
ncbi:MAG: hypothetical protein J5919_06665 [Clostridia bacterium]|nr:hypothetical protein [Clostridia bacterium]